MDTPPGLHNHSVAAAALRSAVEAIPHYQPSLRRPHKCQKRTTKGAKDTYYMRTFESLPAACGHALSKICITASLDLVHAAKCRAVPPPLFRMLAASGYACIKLRALLLDLE